MTMTARTLHRWALLGAAVSLGLMCLPAQAGPQKPFNRIVILLDLSGTMARYLPAAIQKASLLIDNMGGEDRTEKRWEIPDEIYLISIDSKPEVLWAGNRQQLGQLAGPALSDIVKERSGLGQCTDLTAALNLAEFKLTRAPEPTAQYLFVFSDLIEERPLAGRTCTVPKRPSLPPTGVNWDRLADASITVFWVGNAEIQTWMGSPLISGLQIRMYDAAEAVNVAVAAPPKARRKIADSDLAETRASLAKMKSWGFTG
jgi:hypothetical protein